MKIKTRISAMLFLIFCINFLAYSQHTVSKSKVWYASLLKKYFPYGMPIHGITYSLNDIPCLPRDITKFEIVAEKTDIGLGPAFEVRGTLVVGKIMEPFGVIDGAKGKKYMLHLQAYLFSSTGNVLWQQKGFPKGDAWVSANGGSVEFRLINSYRGSIKGNILLILAAGDPIISDYDEWRVVIGIKRINL